MDSTLHYTSVSHADSLVGNINRMRLSSDMCDITVVVGNFRINAHRVVLSACTPYFYQMFYSNCENDANREAPGNPLGKAEYRLDNVDETAALKIIEFCYTSAISVSPDLAWPMLTAAAQLELPEICGLCCDLLASDLSMSSCLGLHLSAVKLGATATAGLLRASSQFMEDNVTELQSSQQLYDLNQHELLELFKSLSESASLSCVGLAFGWLSQMGTSDQLDMIHKLKEICPHLKHQLTDYLARDHFSQVSFDKHQTSSDGTKEICINGRDDLSSNSSSEWQVAEAAQDITQTSGKISTSNCNDSGYAETPEPNKLKERQRSCEKGDEQQVQICVRCGEEFDSNSELVAHQERQCDEVEVSIEPRSLAKRVKESSVEKHRSGRKREFPQARGRHRGTCDEPRSLRSNTSLGVLNKISSGKLITNGGTDNMASSPVALLNGEDAQEKKSVEEIENLTGKGTEVDGSDYSGPERESSANSIKFNDSNNNEHAKVITDKVNQRKRSAITNHMSDKSDSECSIDNSDVVNHDGFQKSGSIEPFPAYARKRSRDEVRDKNDFRCQFCGSDVFDDQEELTSHWRQVHGVCLDASQSQVLVKKGYGHQNVSNLGSENMENGVPGAYLREAKGEEVVLLKKPKLEKDDNDCAETQPVPYQILKTELASSSEAVARSGPWRGKPEDKDEMTSFFQQMQQRYNDLARWYMQQGLTLCSSCMLYHEKDAPCPKIKGASSDHNRALDFSGREEDPSSGFSRTSSVGENMDNEVNEKKGLQGRSPAEVSEMDNESPLDMSKTSHDFSLHRSHPVGYLSKSKLEAEGKPLKLEQPERPYQDSQFLSQQQQRQMELAQYYESYSRMIAAVAGVSGAGSTSITGTTDSLAQLGLQAAYGINPQRPGSGAAAAFGLAGLYGTGSVNNKSNMNALGGSAMANIGSKERSGLNLAEIMMYGSSPSVPSTSPLTGSSATFQQQHQPYSLAGLSPSAGKAPPGFVTAPESCSVNDVHQNTADLENSRPSAISPYDKKISSNSSISGPSSFTPSFTPFQGTDSARITADQSITKQRGRKPSSSKQGFPCTVCSRVFSYQAALFTHMRVHAPSDRSYQCQLCRQTFQRAPDLKVHVCPQAVEKPYVCPSCGQTFAKNIHLKRHLATHSGLKPYPCWLCGKRFSRSDHLKRHTQSIHAGSRPHGCHLCGKEFVRKYELNKHMLAHESIAPLTPGKQDVGDLFVEGNTVTPLSLNQSQQQQTCDSATNIALPEGKDSMQLPISMSASSMAAS